MGFNAVRRHVQRKVERVDTLVKFKCPVINGFTSILPEAIKARARGNTLAYRNTNSMDGAFVINAPIWGCKPNPPKIPSPRTMAAAAVNAATSLSDRCSWLRYATFARRSGTFRFSMVGRLPPYGCSWRNQNFRYTGHRPGSDRGGVGVGVTEFSGVWAYSPR